MNYLTKYMGNMLKEKPGGWRKSQFYGVIKWDALQSYVDDDWEELLFDQNSNYIDDELRTMDKSLRLGVDPSDPKRISKFFLRKERQNAKYN